MALHHAAPGEAVDLRASSDDLPDERSCALVKTDRFEAMRLILHAGQDIPAHHVAGPLTLQCLEGRASVKILPGASSCMRGNGCIWSAPSPSRSRR